MFDAEKDEFDENLEEEFQDWVEDQQNMIDELMDKYHEESITNDLAPSQDDSSNQENSEVNTNIHDYYSYTQTCTHLGTDCADCES